MEAVTVYSEFDLFLRDFVNFAESAKNFKNILKTLAVKNQKKLASRVKSGLFNTTTFLFPGKCAPADAQQLSMYNPLVEPGDLVSDKVIIRGTHYRAGNVVVIKVYSADVLRVGTIIRVVLRKSTVYFLVHTTDAARNKLGFFESLPAGKVDLVDYKQLADFKPLMKRGSNKCFSFILHHHVPTLLD
jgi:hypothetical protein